MALKLKTAVQDLYNKIRGVPKSQLKSQGEMIREDFPDKPGRDYQAKSALLNAVNLTKNKFKPKGGTAPYVAQDLLAPLANSSVLGRIATEKVMQAARGIGGTYADPLISLNKDIGSLEKNYGLRYPDNNAFPEDPENLDEPGKGDFKDLIPVRIGDYQFRGTISGLTDSSNPTWTGTGYAGRPDQIYSYSGVERTLSFDLIVYATSHKDIKKMYQRVNKLYDLTRPTPDDVFQPRRMSAPITKLTLGDYLREQVIMTSLNVAPVEDLSWEINDPDLDYPSRTLDFRYRINDLPSPGATQQRYVVPRALNISFGFTVLHYEVPTTAAQAFSSVKGSSNSSTGY